MAYILGYVTDAEIKVLKERGWDIENFGDIKSELIACDNPEMPHKFCAVYVDNDMFSVMNGPDWDKQT